MPFERFKENHGGQGPFAMLYGAMFPEGVLGRRGLDDERDLTNQLVERISADEKLQGLDGLLAAAQRPLTREQHAAVRGALAQAASSQHAIAAGVEGLQRFNGELRAKATDDELDVLDGFEHAITRGSRYAMSADPELQKQGQAELAAIAEQQRTFARENEKNRIDLETARDAPGVAGEELRYNRDLALSTKLSQAITPLDEQLDALRMASALNTDPEADNIQRQLAFNNVITALDPGARRDPDGRYAGVNGVAIQLQNAYDRALGNPDADAFKAVNQIIDTAAAQLARTRTRTVDTFRNQTQAYGGDVDRVLSVVPGYEPIAKPESTPETETARSEGDDAGPLERAAAAGLAAVQTASAATPDAVKAGLAAAAGLSAPQAVRYGATAARSALVAAGPAGPLALGALEVGRQTAQDDAEALARKPGESVRQYQQRVASYLTSRSGEPIDAGQIRAPREVNE